MKAKKGAVTMTHRQERDPQEGLELLILARGCTYFYTGLCTSFPEQRLKENKAEIALKSYS